MSAASATKLAVASTAGAWLYLLFVWRLRRRQRTGEHRILIAACDLDKTVYPPAGPHRASQLQANVEAMAAFERLGGAVFPVTGNNITQAQAKFIDAAGRSLRQLNRNPGIFCNGSLVLGPGGAELERLGLRVEHEGPRQRFGVLDCAADGGSRKSYSEAELQSFVDDVFKKGEEKAANKDEQLSFNEFLRAVKAYPPYEPFSPRAGAASRQRSTPEQSAAPPPAAPSCAEASAWPPRICV